MFKTRNCASFRFSVAPIRCCSVTDVSWRSSFYPITRVSNEDITARGKNKMGFQTYGEMRQEWQKIRRNPPTQFSVASKPQEPAIAFLSWLIILYLRRISYLTISAVFRLGRFRHTSDFLGLLWSQLSPKYFKIVARANQLSLREWFGRSGHAIHDSTLWIVWTQSRYMSNSTDFSAVEEGILVFNC